MIQSMSLRLQLLLLQALIICAIVVGTGLVAGALQERHLRDSYLDRMVGVAQSVARLPTILAAFELTNPAEEIQPIAEVIRVASNVTYVVVTDVNGIRYSHPNARLVGALVSTDPSVPLSGEMWVGTQTGTLGESWRVKVPVFSADGAVMGTVSVGILESALHDEFVGELNWLLMALGGSVILGLFGSAWVTSIIRRRIYRLEPRDIASLVESRDTMLHGLSEGIINVDAAGKITLANDAAVSLLGLDGVLLAGLPAREALSPSLLAVLERGEPEGQLVLAGERILVARSASLELDGHTVGAALLIRDHTELHSLLRQMDGAQSLTDGLRAQAHEFANTLHVVSGLLELGSVVEARSFIERVGRGGPLGLRGTDTVMNNPELGALLMVKSSQARELGIRLETAELSNFSTVDAASFSGDLVTVIGNLVDNALEACSAGDRIVLTLATNNEELVVAVEDNGPGIAPHLLPTLFIEGVSSKTAPGPDDASQRLHRRGIGLALVRRVAHRHNGEVSAGRGSLGGAVFTVRLPLASIDSCAKGSR
ncbi:sensor histidine kinase [Cryobacterium sp. CG_9.6]|uniref:sensor histidine kinase n=1 Tax=Cryobacterium sp. CG_9.6 TaxID=2760710 RepID=UPI0024763249|nr:sensor histidine kinase [Cryobacterium sp. CG_9.6]MDH6237840.1 two-component system CitB family sensor kinase [Cryobacterium sp. CG_9.6]